MLAARPARAEEGPRRLADLHPKPSGFASILDFADEPTGFVQAGGRLVFSTFDQTSPDEGILWSTDGTAAGTVQLSSSLCPASCYEIDVLAVWHGLAFLRAGSQGQSPELWRTDGTAAGTFPLRGPSGETLAPVEALGDPGSGAVFFNAYTPSDQLWRSDGTQAGTRPVRAADGSSFGYTRSFTFWKGRLYFISDHTPASGGSSTGLWSTDGTPAGTLFLTEIQEGDDPIRLVAPPPAPAARTSGRPTARRPAPTAWPTCPFHRAPHRPMANAFPRTSIPCRRSATRSISRC
jgi:ELWxxDGT repeat protein